MDSLPVDVITYHKENKNPESFNHNQLNSENFQTLRG